MCAVAFGTTSACCAVIVQVQLDSMHQRATATEAKLLDQIGMLQQQLDRERSAR